MSTLMSGDMNLTRPSTRVRVAPGGATTISFGDPSTTTEKSVPVTPVVAVEEVIAQVKKMNFLSVASSSKLVGIALASAVGAEEITAAIAKALAAKGITKVVVSLVEDATILPYLAKQMADKCDVVLAIGVLASDNSGLCPIIAQALIEVGLVQNVPIVPALIAPSSLLELKASLSHCAPTWASSIGSLLALGIVAPVNVSDFEVPEPVEVVAAEAVAEATGGGAAGGRVGGADKPAASSINNSRRAPGGAATIVLG